MAEKKVSGLPLESSDVAENELWRALGEIEAEQPSPRLRQGFYRKLELAGRRTVLRRVRDALGFSGNAGWLTATACLLLGVTAGQLVGNGMGNGSHDADTRLSALEQDVTLLNRRLILDRLENEVPGKRLRGVIDAAGVAADDAEIARALLVRATEDKVPSVRSAAIDALGSRINAPAVGEQLMTLLEQADSPIVQFALVDLVLRYGNDAQVDLLLSLAEGDRLHPDLKRHVLGVLKRDIA